MTKEQQREAAKRILAKEPMTEEELAVLAGYEKKPPYTEDLKALAEHRVCQDCGEEFGPKMVEGEQLTPMQQWADHLDTLRNGGRVLQFKGPHERQRQ